MFVERVERQSKRSKNEVLSGARFQCDVCGKTFERWCKSVITKAMLGKFHYCSRKCQGSNWGSVLRDHNVAKYGVANVSSAPEVRAKREATMLARYGTKAALSSPAVTQRRLDNIARKYGTTRWSQIEQVRAHMSSAAIARCESMSAEQKASWRRQVSTAMKVRGTYNSSRPEDCCYDFLCEKYGVHDVERQVAVDAAPKSWVIDFYVKSIDLYVQVDGVYWHGLNRPIDVIQSTGTKRDKFIASRWHDDRAQDQWFASTNRKLVRVTDADVKAGKHKDVL